VTQRIVGNIPGGYTIEVKIPQSIISPMDVQNGNNVRLAFGFQDVDTSQSYKFYDAFNGFDPEPVKYTWNYSAFIELNFVVSGPTPTPESGPCVGVPKWDPNTIYPNTITQMQYNGNLYENNWYSYN